MYLSLIQLFQSCLSNMSCMLCIFSLSISLVMIMRICVFNLFIIKSKVWAISHLLDLGYETMVCAICLAMFLWCCFITFYPLCGLLAFTKAGDKYIFMLWCLYCCSDVTLIDRGYKWNGYRYSYLFVHQWAPWIGISDVIPTALTV